MNATIPDLTVRYDVANLPHTPQNMPEYTRLPINVTHILVTRANAQQDIVGRVIRVEPNTTTGGWYTGASEQGDASYQFFRGFPYGTPADEGDTVMLLDPPGLGGLRWVIGTAERASGGVYAAVHRITATSDGREFPSYTVLQSPRWVTLTGHVEGMEPNDVLDVERVETWSGMPVALMPLVNGRREILVTGTPRRGDRRIGRVSQVIRDSRPWYVIEGGDYAVGAPVNAQVSEGDTILSLSGPTRGQYGKVHYSTAGGGVMFTPESSEEAVQTRRWVRAHTLPPEQRPDPNDSPEVAELKKQAREMATRWRKTVGSLIREGTSRGWTSHVESVAASVPGFDEGAATSYSVQCAIDVVMEMDERSTPADREEIEARLPNVPTNVRLYRNLSFRDTVAIPIEGATSIEDAWEKVRGMTFVDLVHRQVRDRYSYRAKTVIIDRDIDLGVRY